MSISKNVVKAATGARRDQFVDFFYDALIQQTSTYGVSSDPQQLAYLAQIGHETGGLVFVEELASGIAYEGRDDLGNVNEGDGVRYKGRGLIQLTGRGNYRRAGGYLNEDFENNPESVSPSNQEHKTTGGRTDEYENAVKSSLWFWREGSAWGDLNTFASQIDLEKGLFIGDFDPNRLPDKTQTALGPPFNLQRKRGASNPRDYRGFFLVDYLGLDRDGDGKNLYMFELITLGINGGYNGFRDRYLKFEEGRKALLGDDFNEPTGDQQDQANNNDEDPPEGDDGIVDEGDNDRDREALEKFEAITGIETIIKPTIALDPVSYNAEGDQQIVTDIGKKPFVYLNDVQIDQIEDFRLYSSDFIPTIMVKFVDKYSYYDNLRFPNDDARVRLYISSRSELLRPIFMEFKVTSFTKYGANGYTLKGMMNINNMYLAKVESFNETTSYGVMRKIAELSGLGFATNINDTNDAMTWINAGDKVVDFCRQVVKRSYRSDNSFMWGFVDFYYNLNFIDIQEQMDFDLSKQLGIVTGGINEIQKNLSLAQSNDENFIYLSNDEQDSKTPNYFESYKIFNNSTLKSLKQGYSNRVKYYDWEEKELLIFNMGTIDNDTNVILKSDDEDFFKENVNHFWEGKLSRNAHDNFYYSNIQNDINLNEIQKIGLEMVLPNPNFNLYKFMKIYVLLINQGMTEKNPLFNKKLSGEWLIIDVSFFYDAGEFKQRIKLVRRDLGFSQEEVPADS